MLEARKSARAHPGVSMVLLRRVRVALARRAAIRRTGGRRPRGVMNGDRLEAVIALVQKPDLFDCWRGHHVTQEGKPERFVMYRDLPIRHVNLARFERSERNHLVFDKGAPRP